MTQGRGRLIAILIGAMASSTFQLFALAVLAATLRDELDLSRWQIGLLGAGNTAVGALIAPSFGNLTDRIGARRSVVALCLVSALGLLATALAPVFWVLMLASVVSGLPQGWSNSATNKLIAERLPPGERGTITGLKQSGVQMSIFLAGLTLPTGAELIGWRQTLALYALACLGIALLASVSLADDRPLESVGVDGVGDDEVRAATPDPGRLPGFVYRVALYALFLGLAGGGISRFLPLFANEELGFSEARAGLVVSLSGLLGMGARVIWGQLADRRIAPRPALAILAAGSFATAMLLFAATSIGGWVLWIVAFGMAFFIGAWNVVAMLAVIAAVPSEQAGRGTGVVMLFFLSGLTISSPVVGWSVDQTGDYQTAWLSLAALTVLGVLTMVDTSAVRGRRPTLPSPRPVGSLSDDI